MGVRITHYMITYDVKGTMVGTDCQKWLQLLTSIVNSFVFTCKVTNNTCIAKYILTIASFIHNQYDIKKTDQTLDKC